MYEYVDDPILTVNELMEVLKIGKNLAYQMLNSGTIKAFRIKRQWKIPRASIEEFILTSAKDGCQILFL